MKSLALNDRFQTGFTLVEVLVATAIAIMVFGVLTYASMGITRSISATDQYMIGVANTNRILDAISADVRGAVRVGLVAGSTTIPIKDTGSTTYTVNATNILAISIPDYYGSNTPNNAAGSSYKTTRYPRATLDSSSTYNGNSNTLLNGTIPWAEAQVTVGDNAVTRFAPISAGSGEIQVRYYTGPRSPADPTPCFFRSEYASGATMPSSKREIAERITDSNSTTSVTISGRNAGQTIRLQSSFTPRFSRNAPSATASTAVVEVSIRNPRRD